MEWGRKARHGLGKNGSWAGCKCGGGGVSLEMEMEGGDDGIGVVLFMVVLVRVIFGVISDS